MQNADDLASERDQLQVSADGLRQEMAHVKDQLTEQQACTHGLWLEVSCCQLLVLSPNIVVCMTQKCMLMMVAACSAGVPGPVLSHSAFVRPCLQASIILLMAASVC